MLLLGTVSGTKLWIKYFLNTKSAKDDDLEYYKMFNSKIPRSPVVWIMFLFKPNKNASYSDWWISQDNYCWDTRVTVLSCLKWAYGSLMISIGFYVLVAHPPNVANNFRGYYFHSRVHLALQLTHILVWCIYNISQLALATVDLRLSLFSLW